MNNRYYNPRLKHLLPKSFSKMVKQFGFAPRATIEVSSPQEHAALAKCDEDYNRKRDPKPVQVGGVLQISCWAKGARLILKQLSQFPTKSVDFVAVKWVEGIDCLWLCLGYHNMLVKVQVPDYSLLRSLLR